MDKYFLYNLMLYRHIKIILLVVFLDLHASGKIKENESPNNYFFFHYLSTPPIKNVLLSLLNKLNKIIFLI